MATPFTELFDEFLQTEVDDEIYTTFTDDLAFKNLSLLLRRAREIFRDIILSETRSADNKAEDVVEFQRQTYNFQATGTSVTQVLSPDPPSNAIFFVSVNNIETTDFTFNSGTNEITINNMPNQTNDIYVGAYVNGQFNQTLNLTEIGIFVTLMGLVYLKDKIKKDTLLRHQLEGADYRHSGTQGNHIRALQATYNDKYRRMKQEIIMYAYRNFGYQISEGDANGYIR